MKTIFEEFESDVASGPIFDSENNEIDVFGFFQHKLEEIKKEVVGEEEKYNRFLNELEQEYLCGKNAKRKEVMETFKKFGI